MSTLSHKPNITPDSADTVADDRLLPQPPTSTALVVVPSRTIEIVHDHLVSSSANWKAGLRNDIYGRPLPQLTNVIWALRQAPEWEGLAFDEFSQRIVLKKPAPWGRQDQWTDTSDLLATEWMQMHDILAGVNTVSQAVRVVANGRLFHPVRDYLDTLKWDGVPRLDSWLTIYAGVLTSAYARAVGTKWMIGAVARIYEPGCKVDSLIVLEGEQGKLKSTLLRTLGTPWFTDDISDIRTNIKDACQQLCGMWIVELSELDGLIRADPGRIKAFISRQVDHYRPPYGRHTSDFNRQCVFAGTINLGTYLRDETGGRRFWPVKCEVVNIDALRRDRDQLWAEAREKYKANETWWLDDDTLIGDAAMEQQDRYETDPWHDKIYAFAMNHETVSVPEVLEQCICKRTSMLTQTDKNRVAKSLVSIGWERFRQRVDDRLEWRYKRGSRLPPFRKLTRKERMEIFWIQVREVSPCAANADDLEATVVPSKETVLGTLVSD